MDGPACSPSHDIPPSNKKKKSGLLNENGPRKGLISRAARRPVTPQPVLGLLGLAIGRVIAVQGQKSGAAPPRQCHRATPRGATRLGRARQRSLTPCCLPGASPFPCNTAQFVIQSSLFFSAFTAWPPDARKQRPAHLAFAATVGRSPVTAPLRRRRTAPKRSPHGLRFDGVRAPWCTGPAPYLRATA